MCFQNVSERFLMHCTLSTATKDAKAGITMNCLLLWSVFSSQFSSLILTSRRCRQRWPHHRWSRVDQQQQHKTASLCRNPAKRSRCRSSLHSTSFGTRSILFNDNVHLLSQGVSKSNMYNILYIKMNFYLKRNIEFISLTKTMVQNMHQSEQ